MAEVNTHGLIAQAADDLLSSRKWIAEDTPEGVEVRGAARALGLAS